MQADPIRAPARAQDLTLRHRVKGYRAGDLERRYDELPLEEDHFLNYGFLPRGNVALMHPRAELRPWDRTARARAARVLAFVRERGEVHPREVGARFAHGTVTNYWGGTSSATTHLLEGMHFRGMLRVVRRDAGVRVYGVREATELDLSPEERARALLDLAIAKYAPMPATSVGQLASRLRYAAPQLATHLRTAAANARATYPRARIDGVDWIWLPGDDPLRVPADEDDGRARLLAPFDPVVWDRRRFELFWGWAYRFEAYTPATKRKLGYYALPLLFRDRVIGWANVGADVELGYVAGRAPRDRAFARAIDEEITSLRASVR